MNRYDKLTEMQFLEMVDLAAERLGGRVLEANDDFFAEKENLLKAAQPIFIEGKFTDRGKWMDGWETRRRRTVGFDWCIVELGLPGVIRGIVVDTAFFRGNYPEHCALDASPDGNTWTTLLPQTALKGDFRNLFAIDNPHRYAFVRLNIYPDGGVARLRVHGEVIPEFPNAGEILDLASVVNGGVVLDASDMFFGHRHNLIMPGRSLNMGDGWETKRRRGPGYDWVSVRLGARGWIQRVDVDTEHFKGNYPDSCSLDVNRDASSDMSRDATRDASGTWQTILPKTKLEANTVHAFDKQLLDSGPASRIRLNIYPDGGVARLRVWGSLA